MVRLRAMADQDRRDNQNEEKRRQKYADGGDRSAPEARDQIADERCRDYNRAGTDHPDRHGDQELSLVKPARILDQPLFEKRHDHKSASKSECSCL